MTDLPDLIAALTPGDRALAERLFDVGVTTGRLELPEGMRGFVERSFGSVEAVREQRIAKVTNRVTLEGTLFNELRASRPMQTGVDLDLGREIEATKGDPFCRHLEGTPSDVFGRVRGQHSVTASNVAKYDGFHGVIVFDDHDPLAFTPGKVSDYISVGLEWGKKALQSDPEAKYFFLMWNCLWRAGGSIIHGHAQATATKGMHYPKVESLRRAALTYGTEHGSGYFDDLYRVHDALGLSIPAPDGVRAFVNLVPIKEKEIILVGRSLEEEPLRLAVARTLQGLTRRLGVRSFNAAFYVPPLAPAREDWFGFPVVVRIVDRGDPASRTSDMGAMELYAASVVASDPFAVAGALARTADSG